MASPPSPTLLSLEKKRLRDRRAQRNFRHRKDRYITMLESELSACRGQIMSYEARVRDLERTCSRLHEQNQQLLQSHPHSGVAQSLWQTTVLHPTRHLEPPHSADSQHVQPLPHDLHQSSDAASHQALACRAPKALCPDSNHQLSADNTGPDSTSATHTPSQDIIAPLWSLTPPRDHSAWDTLSTYSPWGGDLRIVLESPDLPSPLELLYGSHTNRLANILHENTRVWRCGESERLAGGWLGYVLAKWMVQPSKARFERLPKFLRPELEQLRYIHPACIDGIVFPQLRINLISKPHLYDLDSVLGMLSCCLKVRWPWGKKILTPSNGAGLCIVPEFYDTFTSIDGWGLTTEFINEYPELLDGLDIQNVHYKLM